MMILSAPLRTSQSCNANKEACGQYLLVERHGALPVNWFPRSPDQFRVALSADSTLLYLFTG